MLREAIIEPNNFSYQNHWYEKVINATIHPIVKHFLKMTQEQVITRYCHLNPKADKNKLRELLNYKSKYFLWGGADLVNVTSSSGKDKWLLLKTTLVLLDKNQCLYCMNIVKKQHIIN